MSPILILPPATESPVPDQSSRTNAIVPRLLDIGAALAALVLLSPVLVLATLLILVSDGQPVLFRQKRVGRNGVPFSILKFRTMRTDRGGPVITVARDSRITRVGAWLRKYKLDELPQFVNVLRGDMSLIGPRPEVPEYVEPDDHLWRAVLCFRPGITDLASLAFRNEEELLLPAADADAYYRSSVLPEKLRMNLRYQRSRSLPTDVRLLWMTARYSLFPAGFDRDRVEAALCTDRTPI